MIANAYLFLASLNARLVGLSVFAGVTLKTHYTHAII